jgi:hypothetical protein
MNVEFIGHVGFDVPKEGEELLMSMPGLALADDGARSDIQSGEQCCRPVAEIIMRHAFDIAETHGQDGLTTLSSLDLSFFIDTKNEGIIWGIEVQTDDVTNLFDEERVSRQRKAPGAVWLNPKKLHVAVNGTSGNIRLPRKLSYRPVGRLAGALLQRGAHQSGDIVIVISSMTMSWWKVIKSVYPIGAVPPTPLGNGGVGDLEFGSDVAVAQAVGNHEDDSCPSCQCMRQAA